MLSGHANLGLGINLWEGAFASARPSECGFTWNVNRNTNFHDKLILRFNIKI